MKKLIYSLISILLFFVQPIFAVNVDFEYKNHCINNIIYFEDLSTSNNKIVAWYWEFGDGSVANDNSPIHVYTESGDYNVKLTIKNELGEAYSLKKSVLINPAPFAFFQLNAKCDKSVGFTDNSFTTSVNLKQRIWNFGDGSYSLEKNPKHFFAKTKKTNVHLKVLDENGCIDSITQLVKIKDKPEVGFEIKNVLLSNPTFIKLNSQNKKDSVFFWINNIKLKSSINLFLANPYKPSLITQTVKNKMGCMDSITTTVSPNRDFHLKLPSHFQPKFKNNTSSFGVNNPNLVVKEMSIFNENGVEVFFACNNTLWDGRNKFGNICKTGVFTYLLEYENPQNIKIIQKGSFVLKSD